jgi:hypothetical protein
LGAILINIICGFMPWKAALLNEPNYLHFVEDPYWLKAYLPISSPAIELIARIFHPDPTKRISLGELRREVQHVSNFLMDDAELLHASDTARAKMLKFAHNVGIDYELPFHDTMSSSSGSSASASPVSSLSYSYVFTLSYQLDTPSSATFEHEPLCEPASIYPARRNASVLSRILRKLHLRSL